MEKKNSILFWFTLISEVLGVVTLVLLFTIGSFYSNFKLIITLTFMALTFVPYLIKLIFKFRMPNYVYICYFIFIWLSTLLGTIYGLYNIISFYDTIVHTFSGVILGAFGYYIYKTITKTKKDNMFIIALFTISFAVLLGVLWEFWEFWTDEFFNLNSQRHTSPSGEQFLGHDAIRDTIYDLMADIIGAIAYFIVYCIYSRIKHKKQEKIIDKDVETIQE